MYRCVHSQSAAPSLEAVSKTGAQNVHLFTTACGQASLRVSDTFNHDSERKTSQFNEEPSVGYCNSKVGSEWQKTKQISFQAWSQSGKEIVSERVIVQ
jgi:hypothetical protein